MFTGWLRSQLHHMPIPNFLKIVWCYVCVKKKGQSWDQEIPEMDRGLRYSETPI